MSTVPRPITQLTEHQRQLLADAVEAAQESREAESAAATKKETAWAKLLAGRAGGVPDELLCEETGFSRATLNRKYGPRQPS